MKRLSRDGGKTWMTKEDIRKACITYRLFPGFAGCVQMHAEWDAVEAAFQRFPDKRENQTTEDDVNWIMAVLEASEKDIIMDQF